MVGKYFPIVNHSHWSLFCFGKIIYRFAFGESGFKDAEAEEEHRVLFEIDGGADGFRGVGDGEVRHRDIPFAPVKQVGAAFDAEIESRLIYTVGLSLSYLSRESGMYSKFFCNYLRELGSRVGGRSQWPALSERDFFRKQSEDNFISCSSNDQQSHVGNKIENKEEQLV